MKKNKRTANFGWFGAAASSGIFQIIRHEGPISRSKMAFKTGLSKSMVSLHIEQLLKMGLIKEELLDGDKDKRRKNPLKIAEDAGVVIGVILGSTELEVGLCDLEANVLDVRKEDLSIAQGPDFVLDCTYRLIDELLSSLETEMTSIFGIGVGVPGDIEYKTGTVISSLVMPGWYRYPVGEKISEKYGCPVFVDNDVNVMALGAKYYGIGKNVDNFVFVKIGSRIGAGIIIEGKVYRGAGSVGNIGHIRVEGVEELCPCGNQGCLVMVAGTVAIARKGQQLATQGKNIFLKQKLEEAGEVSVEDVGIATKQGDLLCSQIIRESGRAIGLVLATLVNLLNPSLIVVGSELIELREPLLAGIREVAYIHGLPSSTSELLIKPASIGKEDYLTSAAMMVLEEIFSHSSVTEMIVQFPEE